MTRFLKRESGLLNAVRLVANSGLGLVDEEDSPCRRENGTFLKDRSTIWTWLQVNMFKTAELVPARYHKLVR